MGWRNWPSWVKGGILGAFLALIITLALMTGKNLGDCTWRSNIKTRDILDMSNLNAGMPLVPCTTLVEEIIILSMYIISFPLMLALKIELPFKPSLGSYWLPPYFYLAYSFSFIIYGIIIGWIYGKIKSSKKSKN